MRRENITLQKRRAGVESHTGEPSLHCGVAKKFHREEMSPNDPLC